MRRRRDIKIHRYEKKSRRREAVGPGRTFLSICFTFIIAGVIGIIGYSIAKPILIYTAQESSSEDLSILPGETTIPAAVSEDVVQTEVTDTTTEEKTEPTTETVQTEQSTLGFGIYLDSTALTDLQTLKNAIETAKTAQPDATFLVVPLKIQGGTILYKTTVALAEACGAAQGTLTLEEILSAVEEAGLMPVAQCSLLYDNLLPEADATAGYVIAASGTRWLDNSADNGGKPWVSPFSTVTVQYLTDLITEISAAGFVQVWCSDVMFPDFRTSDLEYIGEIVQDANRGDTLTALLNILSDAAADVPIFLETDAASLLDGTEEAFDAEMLEISGIVLDLGTETDAETMLSWRETNAADWYIVLSLSADNFSVEMTKLDTANAETDAVTWVLYE